MTAIFKMFGNGDAMTGMTYMTYGFVGIILLVIIICAIMITRNTLDERKKDSVALKSKTAEKKVEQLKKGLFNYDIIDGEDESLGLDPTDPANQKRNTKHRNANMHKGLKPANLNSLKKNTPKVELKKAESPLEPAPAPVQTNANTTVSNTITEPPAPTTGTRIFTDTGTDTSTPAMITNQTQQSFENDYRMPSFTDDNNMQFEQQSIAQSMAPVQQQMQAPGVPTVQAPTSNPVQSVQPVQQSVPQYESQSSNVQRSIPDNPFAMPINPDSFMKNN